VLRRAGNWLIGLVLFLALASGAGSLALGRPVLATVIKSDSMYPVYQRGDVAFLWNWPGAIGVGDIILFRPSEGALMGQWTMHRVAGLGPDGRFLTQGDAANATDQHDRLAGPVSRDQVGAKAITVGGLPLRVPRIGELALHFSGDRSSMQQRILVLGLFVLVVVAGSELARQGRRRRRGEEVDPRLVFIGVGSVLSVLLIAMTLYQTVRITLVYEVGPDPGVIMGQPVGMITPGDVVRKELSRLENKGFMPMILLLSEQDANVFADAGLEILAPQTERTVNVEVRGNQEGSFRSLIELSLVFPLLPAPVVASLARVNHWLAALSGCVVPGLAIMLLGILEPVNRRRTARDLRVALRRLATPFSR
jgi:signal peptidase